MTVIIVLLAALGVAVRTMLYGIWTIKQHNISGGIFVILLSATSIFLAARYFFIS